MKIQQALVFSIVKIIIKLYYDLYSYFIKVSTLSRYIPGIKIPEDSIIYWRCRFCNPSGIHIGHNTIISNDAFLDGRCGITIGNNVLIGAEVRIYTMKHDIESPSFEAVGNLVSIQDWAYIANRVTIFEGVTIGEGAVVCTGAIVVKDVEPWTMVGGVPAKFIKNRPVSKYTLNANKVERLY